MTQSKNVVRVDSATFDREVLAADRPVLVDFTATWCGPCKALAPILDRIADENTANLKVVAVDIDDAPDLAQRYGIRGAPTVMVFRGGQKTAQHLGLTTRTRLLAMLDAAAPADAPRAP